MRLSQAEYLQVEARLNSKRKPVAASGQPEPVEREVKLHESIMKHCAAQWPRWKYRHARTDKRTTEEVGTEDFTIFLPGGVTLHLECKARGGKQSPEQLAWAKQLEMLEHRLYVVTSFDKFLEIVRKELP